jgi:hypothetical protein
MPVPAGIATVTVTGKYIKPDGTPLAGSVTFAADAAVRLPDQDATALGSVSVALDTAGAFSVVLIATDNADARPIGYTYTVTETLTGMPTRTYSIALPQATPAVDLADIAPAVASSGEYLLVTGPAGKTILSGTTAPGSGVGTNGDFYLDYVAWTIYGPKSSGAWPSGHALGSGGAVATVNGYTGTVVLTAADVGAATPASVSSAVSAAVNSEVTRADGAYLHKESNLTDVTDTAAARTALGVPAVADVLSPLTAASTYAPLTKADTGPWVFNVITGYGAKGDGKTVTDGAMTSGAATLTCAGSSPFASSDVGKKIMIKGAAASGVTSLVATITGFTDSGHITLSTTAATTVSSAVVMWGTDDTAAIQSAINAAVSWASANGGAARVFFPVSTGFYVVAGALQTGGTTKGNAQLTLPVIPVAGKKITLHLEGATSGASLQHWQQTVPQTSGSTLVSFGVFASTSAQSTSITANGNASVIGGPTQPNGYGTSALLFSNMAAVVRGLNILTAYSTSGIGYGAMDLSGLACADVQDYGYGTTGVVVTGDYGTPASFSAGLSAGLLMPANAGNDMCILRNVTCHGGYTYAVFLTEHTTAMDLRVLYSWSALCVTGSYFGGAGASHAFKALQVSVESCVNAIHLFGAGAAGIGPFLDIDQLDTEMSAPLIYDQDSAGSALAAARGTIRLTGLYTPANIATRSGLPTGLRIVDGQQSFPVTAKTSSYSVSLTDGTILVNASGGPVTVTLISAVATPNSYTVKKTDSSANAVTVAARAGETIDGAASASITDQWATISVIPSGGNWYVV